MKEGGRRLSPFEMRVRQYGWRHREEVRALLGRSKVLTEREVADRVKSLDGIGVSTFDAPVLALVVQCTAYEMALGLVIAQVSSGAVGHWLIRLLVIDPENRRRGLGSALLKAAEKAARTRGVVSLNVSILPSADSAAADAFLLKHGYRKKAALEANADSLYLKDL